MKTSVEHQFPFSWKESSKPHKFCPGCGHPITLKMLGEVIDELGIAENTVFLVDIGCSLLAWDFFNIDTTQTHHGRTLPVATGFKMMQPNAIVIAYVGDGGGYAIGLQHLIHTALRNIPITTILINNANYGMTGGQLAPTTLLHEKTVTTPDGRNLLQHGETLHGPELIKNIAAKDSYIARGTVNQPLILKSYIKNALLNQIENKGFSFVESLSFCPTNWRTDASESIAFLNQMEKEFVCKEF